MNTLNASLLPLLAKNWWVLLLRGLAGIAFALLAFTWPKLTLVTLILFYGAYLAVEGVMDLVAAIRGGTMAPRWWLAIAGVVALAGAIATFLVPGLTALVLLYIIAGWAIARGVFEIIGAIMLRRQIDNEWLLIFSGILSAVFGICILLWPGAGALSLIWIIGAYALAAGVLCVGFAFRLKRHQTTLRPT